MQRLYSSRRLGDSVTGRRDFAAPKPEETARPERLPVHPVRGACQMPDKSPDEPVIRRTLSEPAARQLANATKTRAQWSGITPRWLVSFLPWSPGRVPGIYRLNRVKEAVALTDADVECSPRRDTDSDLPETFVNYEAAPREYSLNAVSTVLDVQTRVSGPVQPSLRSDSGTAETADREGQGTAGKRARQQPNYGLLRTT